MFAKDPAAYREADSGAVCPALGRKKGRPHISCNVLRDSGPVVLDDQADPVVRLIRGDGDPSGIAVIRGLPVLHNGVPGVKEHVEYQLFDANPVGVQSGYVLVEHKYNIDVVLFELGIDEIDGVQNRAIEVHYPHVYSDSPGKITYPVYNGGGLVHQRTYLHELGRRLEIVEFVVVDVVHHVLGDRLNAGQRLGQLMGYASGDLRQARVARHPEEFVVLLLDKRLELFNLPPEAGIAEHEAPVQFP